MKVLFLTKSYPIYGGVERFLADLVQGLTGKGFDCRVGLANGRTYHKADLYARAYSELRWFPLHAPTGSPIGRRMAIAKALVTHRPDIVIPLMLADGLHVASKLKNLLDFRIVYSVHEIGDGVAKDINLYGHSLDCVVVPDKTTKDLVKRNIDDSGKINVISHGVPVGRPGARKSSDKLRIGYCGRLQQAQKRISDLVDIVAKLEKKGWPYSLTVAGDGPDRAWLEKEIGATTKTGEVAFLGAKDRSFLYEVFYPEIDVLIITSDWETGPLVAFEAMMHQCVVVTADYRGRRENAFLEHEKNALVFPVGDIERTVACLGRLRADHSLAATLGKQGRMDALSGKSLDRMIDRWDTVVRYLRGPTRASSANDTWNVVLDALSISPEVAKEFLRRGLGRAFPHKSAGEEWPFYNG